MKIKRLLTSTLVACSLALPLGSVSAESAKKPARAEQIQGKVNINTADAEAIAGALKGIGLKKAQAIVSYRKQLGGKYKSLDQLLEVKGIGEKTLAKLKSQITL
ncbi:ComEA family DNA-binding protein [Porticoccus sp. W117]|uniref:ComEA family DNA-binding protein n=1 Tax=Porticoccus sp. W117 TaxID=3054777 RepID=UPI002591E988|nr:ComEA family DNA-binding protein [Porticoccus sp. W117]MDM3872392.1 ComEA family DNA-binding protein [Porticoccus sp. W117]